MGEPVKKPILYGGRFAGLNREYSGNIPGNIPSALAVGKQLGAVYRAARDSVELG